ncbi:MAG: protein-glutamate O-methyltransferase CheR [Myxococcales bacterium]|nr:protein-glutamate O-methyltransferase CheR [Myxococcota bacterium]MDW8281493.1 protein-glutamate O-methyltransferase CheR [Myxococcales bacterium]
MSVPSLPTGMSTGIPMTEGEFQLLRQFICDQAGILYEEGTSYLLRRRLQPRLEALGLHSFHDYYRFLTDPSIAPDVRMREVEELLERVVTRETYFFRESCQLDAFRNGLLPLLHRKQGRNGHLNIWSAGCATGEEPYTLAIHVLASGLFHPANVQILGTDLSRSALEVARAAVYGPSSFRQADFQLVECYFRRVPGGRRVIDEVKRMVTFHHLNLLDPNWQLPIERFDVIFCRNVLIYLDRTVRGVVIRRLSDRLVRGGYLLLGHSEWLGDVAYPLEALYVKRQLVYRKPP